MAVHDYYDQVAYFLKENFEPCDYNRSNVKHTTSSLLGFLYATFPRHCISEYELNEILNDQGYVRQTWTEEHTVVIDDDKENPKFEIHKTLVSGWCMRTDHDLVTERISSPSLFD